MNAMLKWMAEHPVAGNLTMMLVLIVGLLSAAALPQKTFPDFSLDVIDVRVTYPGASPSEIEQSIIRPIEDQLSGIDGVDSITATAREGAASVALTLQLGEDIAAKLDDIKAEVDRISVFPEDAEEPSVAQRTNRTRVLEITISGDAPEAVLKGQAERLSDELVLLPEISFVETANTRNYEISIEIDRDALKAFGLTLQQVANIVAANSLELPSGQIETATLTIPLRTVGRNYTRVDFENIVIVTNDAGGKVLLRDVATVVDGFEDADIATQFGDAPAVTVNVFRIGDEQVLDVVAATKAHLAASYEASLPPGLEVTLWQNDAEELQNRIDLLVKNAVVGLALVILCLTLFLDFRLAFWSAVGIAVSFAGSFAIMGMMGMSINMISLFGFILAIGIVVDNAIVISEKIYTEGEAGKTPMQAAVQGVQRVAVPVIFSALTTIVAFTPLLQLPGVLGKFLGDIPTVVIIVLTLSLLQALLILPRNLSRLDVSPNYRPVLPLRLLGYVRKLIDMGLQWVIRKPLHGLLDFVTRRWLVPIGATIGMMIITVAIMVHGYVRFEFFPSIDGAFITANIEMNDGTAFDRTQAVADEVRRAGVRAGERISATLPQDSAPVIENTNVVVGVAAGGGGPFGDSAGSGGTVANVVIKVTDAELRTWPAAEFETLWREEIGAIAGMKTLVVSASLFGAGDPVAIEMSLPDNQDIAPIVAEVEDGLRGIPGVFGIRDDLSAGRLEYTLALRQDARVFGVSLADLAQQMRAGFFGIEATRVQRGADDVRVFVRLPQDQRDSLSDLLDTEIRTSAGDLIPLSSVAEIREARSPTEILRRDGRKITTITADVDTSVITGGEANEIITTDILPRLQAENPGLIIEFGGEQAEQGDAAGALGTASGIALFIIFALLALVFRSYVQPIVVMTAIPLGLMGAVAGHLIMDISLGLLSIFGIIGLAGVVINNSLVMLDLYNEYLAKGYEVRRAVIEGTKDRFRPIFLTSLTTFLGVFPLIMETSLQAQFLIPLAVSIGFGVLFGTVIIIFTVPAVFMAQWRAANLMRRLFGAEPLGLVDTSEPDERAEPQGLAPKVEPVMRAPDMPLRAAE
jgi:multidrug efflux pump subunit AcrB